MVTSHPRRAGACLLTLVLLLAGCRSRSPLPDNSPPETASPRPFTVSTIEPEVMDRRSSLSLTCQGGQFDLRTLPEDPGLVYCASIAYGGQRLDFDQPIHISGGNFGNQVFVTDQGALAVLLTDEEGSDGYFLTGEAVYQFHTAEVADGWVFLTPGEAGGLRFEKVMAPCTDLLQAAARPPWVSLDDTYSQSGTAVLGAEGLTFQVEHTTTVRERIAQLTA